MPHHLSPCIIRRVLRTRLPSPKATRNNISPIPTTCVVLACFYRCTGDICRPGHVVGLHPDVIHDGHAGTEAGFGYRQLYVEPALIFEAVQVLCGHGCALPFVRSPVVMNPKLSGAITAAFEGGREPLAIDSLVVQVAEGLLEADPSCTH